MTNDRTSPAAPSDDLARERLWYGWLSMAAALVIFAGKLWAYQLTASTAVLSDAMESVVNVVAASVLVFSLRIAARPADEDHPYGHGKIEFFSAGIEATFIFVAGVLILLEAGHALWRGAVPKTLDAGLLVLGICGLLNAGLGFVLLRAGRRLDSMAIVADAKHVLVDVWTSVAVIAGLAVVDVTGLAVLDPLIAIAVAGHILFAGWRLGRDAVDGLMDAADEQSLATIAGVLEERREHEWIDIHGLRSWRSGAVVHVDFHLIVPRYFDVLCVHEIHEHIEHTLATVGGLESDVVVHFDPCSSAECSSCAMPDCPVREAEFVGRLPFTVESVRRSDELAEAER